MENKEIVQLLPNDKRLKKGESAASWIARIMDDPSLVKTLVQHQINQHQINQQQQQLHQNTQHQQASLPSTSTDQN